MPRAMWGAWGISSKPPFVDQVAEAGLMSPGDFAHEILGQLQVALRAGQADVPKVRSQKRQLCAEIDVLFTPQQKPENGKRMSQVMETNVPVAAGLVNGLAQGGNRIPAPAWGGKERLLGRAGAEVLGCQRPAASVAEPGPAQSEPFLTCRTWYAGYAAGLRRGRHRPV